MTDFSGETLTSSSEFTISVDTWKISDNAQDIGTSALRIGAKEAELETAASNLKTTYEGDSSVEFYNAYMVLKYRHDKVQTQLGQVSNTLIVNASNNTKINLSADMNAQGGK